MRFLTTILLSFFHVSMVAQIDSLSGQLFVSFEDSIGVLNIDTLGAIDFVSFPSVSKENEGIYYNSASDILYQVDHLGKQINAYKDIVNNDLTLASSTESVIESGRGIDVSNDKLVVASVQDNGTELISEFNIFDLRGDDLLNHRQVSTTTNLWDITLFGAHMFAADDGSNRIAYYWNFLHSNKENIEADYLIEIEGLNQLRSVEYYQDLDIMLITDVGSFATPYDGSIVVVDSFSEAVMDTFISKDEYILLTGQGSMLEAPVSVTMSKLDSTIFVAERSTNNGLILAFDFPETSADSIPIYQRPVSSANSLYFNNFDHDPIQPLGVLSRLIISSSDSTLGFYNYVESDTLLGANVEIAYADGMDLKFNTNNNKLYHINNSEGLITGYHDVFTDNFSNGDVFTDSTFSVGIHNPKALSILGNIAVATERIVDSIGTHNYLVRSELNDSITILKKHFVDVEFSGLYLLEGRLLALENNSSKIHVFYSFQNQTKDTLEADLIIEVENFNSNCGIDYSLSNDELFLTSIAVDSIQNHGTVIRIKNFSGVSLDGFVSLDEQEIVSDESFIKSPIDIEFDEHSKQIFIADTSVLGGAVVGINSIDNSIDTKFTLGFPNITAIDISNEILDYHLPSVPRLDPSFTEVIHFLGDFERIDSFSSDGNGLVVVDIDTLFEQARFNITISGIDSVLSILLKDEVEGFIVYDFTNDYFDGRIDKTISVDEYVLNSLITGRMSIEVSTKAFPQGEITAEVHLDSPLIYISGIGQNLIKGLALLTFEERTETFNFKAQLLEFSSPILLFEIQDLSGNQLIDLTPFLLGSSIDHEFSNPILLDLLENQSVIIALKTQNPTEETIIGEFGNYDDGIMLDGWMVGKEVDGQNQSEAFGLALLGLTEGLSEVDFFFMANHLSSDLTSNSGLYINKDDGEVELVFEISPQNENIAFNEASIPISFEAAKSILRGNSLIKASTELFSAGEVTAQLFKIPREGISFNLCQGQAVPTPSGAGKASGQGYISYDRFDDNMFTIAQVNMLDTDFEGAHIRDGLPFQLGPVLYNFSAAWEGTQGGILEDNNVFTSILPKIIEGETYMNLATSNNPVSFLRGQIERGNGCPEIVNVIEEFNDVEIQVSPNPVQEILKIDLHNLSKPYNLTIYNVDGQKVFNELMDSNSVTINISEFTIGMYIVHVIGEGVKGLTRFVKI